MRSEGLIVDKHRQIYAKYDDETITVYQAYSECIAVPAVQEGRFVMPFSMDRMTWIKPSFCWMMYRSGWAMKSGQEHVLAIRIKRSRFEWALRHACLSHFSSETYLSRDEWRARKRQSEVRVQWDPERDIHLNRLERRAIQVGLSGRAVELYVNDWIVEIENISDFVHEIAESRNESALPVERLYPLDADVLHIIGAKHS